MPRASTAAGLMLAAAGVVLMVASPFLTLLGGWGGADSGTVARGIAVVLGVPWAIFLVSTAAAILLLNRNCLILGCLAAMVPALAKLWIAWQMLPAPKR